MQIQPDPRAPEPQPLDRGPKPQPARHPAPTNPIEPPDTGEELPDSGNVIEPPFIDDPPMKEPLIT